MGLDAATGLGVLYIASGAWLFTLLGVVLTVLLAIRSGLRRPVILAGALCPAPLLVLRSPLMDVESDPGFLMAAAVFAVSVLAAPVAASVNLLFVSRGKGATKAHAEPLSFAAADVESRSSIAEYKAKAIPERSNA